MHATYVCGQWLTCNQRGCCTCAVADMHLQLLLRPCRCACRGYGDVVARSMPTKGLPAAAGHAADQCTGCHSLKRHFAKEHSESADLLSLLSGAPCTMCSSVSLPWRLPGQTGRQLLQSVPKMLMNCEDTLAITVMITDLQPRSESSGTLISAASTQVPVLLSAH
jgi:hypothetical protein